MGYSKYVLVFDRELDYVSALHSNQSTIESLFSNIRMNKKDRTDLYATGILEMNIAYFTKKNIKKITIKIIFNK